ncbi:hypothetical protein DPMN_178865 [Dreissena polymorpha]|uniref:Uncharacterized protein n=1 Tax=Dreissena polymorpha TaxID=45954 RepID=A0A9D4EG25_DREPO|nr:hypothetical protein DPMN_178865 [Dreissena polymorpha]
MAEAVAAAVGAWPGLVQAGTSIAGVAALNTGPMINVKIEVGNFTSFELTDPQWHLEHGQIRKPPSSVDPGYKETMLATKHSRTASFCYVVVSYRTGYTGNRLVIMWSVPFNCDLYDNWFAVGIRRAGRQDSMWLSEMYSAAEDKGIWFERAKYSSDVPTLAFIDNELELGFSATINTTNDAKVLVHLSPTKQKVILHNVGLMIR